MRIIVTGCRNWACDDLAAAIVGRLVGRYGRDGLVIVHGGASGVDSAFHNASVFANVAREVYPADWQNQGKRAGPIRNGVMVAKGADLCIAVHKFLMNSKGTRDCCNQAIAAGIPTFLIDSDAVIPMRLRADDPRLE
jgi:hypothetical protein